jgi:polysaccharide biosynthesis protein VpsJ
MADLSNKPELMGIVECLFLKAQKADFKGYDPFDGMNSSILKRTGLDKSQLASIAWLQFHKRSPINFRNLAGVEKKRNPKGIALFILGLVALFDSTSNEEYLRTASDLGDWLLSTSVDRAMWGNYAWGYHFDWAARAFRVPIGKPNAITTCYAARALYELGRATGRDVYRDAAIDAGRFLDGLYVESRGFNYFAYIPGESAFVHNANLWTAALVAKSAACCGDAEMARRAITAARQTVSMQRGDGAWVYGTRHHHNFIDGFHTGYNLEALSFIQDALKTQEFQSAIDSGMSFYRDNFILEDGTVKYYDNCAWPLDTHSFAEAVLLLTNVGGTGRDLEMAQDVIRKMLGDLYLKREGRFIYQKGRFISNRCDYIRWTQAWAFYALSDFIRRFPVSCEE